MTLLKGKRRSPNIVRGGRAIPFGNPNDNLYYLQGRSHAKGGIDIGANPRTGIEAEGGEVVQIKPNELRVLSAQDFIGGGVSPAKQVLAGANPDKVFNDQERFKDRHRLNDDGTKYETGGDKTYDAGILPTVDIVGDYNTYWRATKKKKANQIANAVRQGTSDFVNYVTNGPITQAVDIASLATGVGLLTNSGIKLGKHLISNYKDYKAILDFMSKYNYKNINPKTSIIFDDKNLDRLANNLVERHNTFVRGTNVSDYNKAKELLTTVPVSRSPYNHGLNDFENALYTSNNFNTARQYAGNNGYVGILQRPIKRGQKTRREFLKDNDFVLTAIPDLYDSKYLRITDKPYKSYKAFISGTDEADKYIKLANDIYENEYNGQPITKELRNKIFKQAKEQYNKLYNGDIPVNNEIRGNKGILYNPDDEGYRDFLFLGDTGDKPLILKQMIKYEPLDSKNTRTISTGLSHKKLNGGMIATINGNVKNGLISTPRPKAKGGTDIHIKSSKRGTFTAAAKAHGKSVQGFASQVLANKDNYSSAMVKKANFARNASKWNHKAYGGRKKFEPGGKKTITDVDRGDKKNDKIWLETFGTDSDILDRARYDTEAMNAMARRHADLVETSGYNPDSGKAIQHEGVGQYQQDFNSKFWNPNRKLYNEITPAGNSGDNQLGSFNDKDYMGNMTYLRTPTGLYTPETVEFWRRKGFRATNYKGYNQLEYMLNPLKAPDIDINVPNPKLSNLSPIGHNTPPTGGQDKTPQSPTPRRGIRWNDDLTSLAGNVLGSLGSFGADLWGANLRSWTPYTESPVKLKTNWNINPQLDRIRESSQEAYRDIDANTASSSTALARKQRVRNQAQYAANEQWGLKENKETELINKDKLNLQGVRNRNTNRLNHWAESDANIANMRRRLRGAAVSNLFDNLNKSLQGYIGRRDQRRRDEATERMFNRAYPHGAAMARDIQSRESSGDATIPSLATNPIAIVGRLATERLDDDIVAQTKKRCGGKIKRK